MKPFQHGGNVWVNGRNIHWLDFSANINPYGPPQNLKTLLHNTIDQVVHYPDPEARHAHYMASKYLGIPPEHVLLTSGGIHALDLVMRLMCPVRTIIIQPGFVEYERIAHTYQSEIVHLSMYHGINQYFLDLERIRATLIPNSMLFLCNPSNPTGQCFSRQEVLALLSLIESKASVLVVDEAFIHYCQQISVIQEVRDSEALIVIGSFTKILAIPGVRLGYLAAPQALITRCQQIILPWHLNLFAQKISESLCEFENFELDSVRRNCLARKAMAQSLRTLGFKVNQSVSNFMLLDISHCQMTAGQINKKLHNYHMMWRDCANFRGLNDHYARVAVKKPEQNLKLVLALKEIIKCGI